MSQNENASPIDDHVPAFPIPEREIFGQGKGKFWSNGMTLRDYFATHATEQDISKYAGRAKGDLSIHGVISRQEARYIHADKMLEARKK